MCWTKSFTYHQQLIVDVLFGKKKEEEERNRNERDQLRRKLNYEEKKKIL